MRGVRRLVWLAAALPVVGCASIAGLSDYHEDPCAFGCDGGDEGGSDVSVDAIDSAADSDATRVDGPLDDGTKETSGQDVVVEATTDAGKDATGDAHDAAIDTSTTCGNLNQACCGTACNSPLTCQANMTCGCGTLSLCNGACVDTQTDPNHCSSCAMVCAAGTNETATCSNGVCGEKCDPGFADCAGTGTSCAVNLNTDPANCGACGHSCLGGLCVASACQPVTLASAIGQATGIALDATYVYFTSPNTGLVGKVAIATGAVSTIATGSAPYGIAVDATNVYWADSGNSTLMKAALSGGTPTTIVTLSGPPRYIALGGGTLYTGLIGANTSVVSVAVTGGAVTTIATGQKYPYGMAIDTTNVYWGSFANGPGLTRYPLAGGSASQLAGGTNVLMATADGTDVYWSEYTSSGTINKATKTGGNLQMLATGQSEAFGLTTDASYVYWTNSTTAGSVVRVPINGGTSTTLATDNIPNQIANDSKALYWGSAGKTAVMMLAK